MPARRPQSPPGRPAARPAARGGAAGRSSRPTSSARTSASGARGAAARPAVPRTAKASTPKPKVAANGSVPASARGTGARAILNRPGGPARDDRRRSHTGLVLPEVLTVRLLVLAVVVLIAAVLLVPTVRAAVQQRMELSQLRGQVAARQAEADDLQSELDRWQDNAYVEGQARERLLMVMPGDHVWRTVGDDGVVEDIDPATGKKVDAGIVGGSLDQGAPWYTTLWGSVGVADGPVEPSGDPTSDPTPEPSLPGTPDDTGADLGGAVEAPAG